ncbi:MAG: nicotinate phosphoribosyltransferase [Cytophagales bacterium]|nr:nicotinate phosphoribosyltransferase [Armatimonadota bacterium]
MIIESLLDTDLYKYTMQQAVWSQFPQASVEYAFKCRNGVDLRPYAVEIQAEIDHLGELSLRPDEQSYLAGIRFIKPGYVDSLRRFLLDPANVRVTTSDGELGIRVRGSWFHTILFEVPILAIVNEVYFRSTEPDAPTRGSIGREKLLQKCEQINAASKRGLPLRVIEFGTRRRYSRGWQREVVQTLKSEIGDALIGTSNLLLAKEFGLRAFGTMAHEFLQAGQAFVHLADSQKFALEAWNREYRGDLGIALSDVFGMDAFLHDFDLLFSKTYDGARHDSGDPFVWGEKLIAHYETMGIDSRTKTAVFSDSLDIPKMVALAERFEGRIRTQFGIGTNLTNDFDFPPLPIVLKMVRCNGRPTVKVSDSLGKTMSEDDVYLRYVHQTFGLH